MRAQQSSIVSKCTQVLDILAQAGRPLGFTEIVRRSGFVKSSTHRVLSVLKNEGLVETQGRAYLLGPKILNWAAHAWHQTDLQQVASGELEALAKATGHNCALAIRHGDSALYIKSVGSYRIRYGSQAGDHTPLHCTAIGKVLVAFMPDEERRNLMPRLHLDRYTEYTITDPEEFAREINRVRNDGYGSADREEFLQVCGIAAPIFDFQGRLAAGICVWSVIERGNMDSLLGQVPLLQDTTRRISARLGYTAD
jgi:DNA-binding IclR family transcriptional regulator